ncbi:MAG: acetyl-CoA carboxylase carboxyl transferase subunit alpha [Evtepia sp.]|jgi:acetyl-CoA carboxylase carboxyl transferase subunit alpha|nr:acetyl-CoA carboxylase carboxyl transferase subunit alpha [Evtepia sp.]
MSSTAYDKVKLARANNRPTSLSYINNMFSEFFELHGDRAYADDPAIVGGVALLYGMPVTVIGIEKGRSAKERVHRNFGASNPEGYRKALRLMRQAEKYHRPVICFVDTSGAFCGIGAEERGQGQAIAHNLMVLSDLKTPVLSILIGEGGSGGALALCVADEVWMLENSIYSVISPEGCASILWKDSGRAADAAECLKLTAQDAFHFGIADKILPESGLGSVAYYRHLSKQIYQKLGNLLSLTTEDLIEKRYQRFRKFGAFDLVNEEDL